MGKIWSPYQETIFAFIADPSKGNAIVNAVAGSGKSTTMVEGCNHIPPGKSHIMLAFNKAIAEELKGKGVNARTFHSLTYTPVTRFVGTSTVETNKLRKICQEALEQNDNFLYATFCCRMVGLAKSAGVGVLVDDKPHVWYDLADHHNIDLESADADFDRGIQLSQWLLQASNASRMVDFDDLLYLSVLHNIRLPKFDFVFVDEAQDTNAIQRCILTSIMHEHSRMIAVGDPRQAIYGFRGADNNSIKRIGTQFNAEELPLTVTYRCGSKIVEYAQTLVPYIEAAPGAHEGAVHDLGTDWKLEQFAQDDLVICRNTKPLVQLAYRLLRERIPVHIMGREIGQGLKSLIGKMDAEDIDQLIDRLEVWSEREQAKVMLKNDEAKAEAIRDKVDAIITLAETLPETNRTIRELVSVITTLFSDQAGGALTLATIHKSKGMEAKRVWWLNPSLCPAKYARKDWQREQEYNLMYVAITRAKTDLFKIEDGR